MQIHDDVSHEKNSGKGFNDVNDSNHNSKNKITYMMEYLQSLSEHMTAFPTSSFFFNL